jgi:hypothetical protein
MTWRVGSKVPINVYDGDRPVCQCHTVADARLIALAVNQFLDRKLGDNVRQWRKALIAKTRRIARYDKKKAQKHKPGSRTP